MKKSTLIVVAVAIALAATVYFEDVRRAAKHPSAPDNWTPAFSFTPAEVTQITVNRQGDKIVCVKRNGTWLITEPIETRGDQAAIGNIATDLSNARTRRSFPIPASGLKSFGLDPPKVSLDIQLNNGKKHRLRLGDIDFSGILAYALVDDGKQIVMLPESLLGASNRPLDQLRDSSVLGIPSGEVAYFDLKNRSGEIVASKKPAGWQIEKPRKTPADVGEIGALLGAVTAAKWTGVVSETPKDLGKYGLERAAITLELKGNKGQGVVLLVGRKAKNDYYARDTSRPTIFRISDDLVKKLDEKFFDLRDKSLVHFEAQNLASVQIKNQYQTVVCVQGKDDKWTIEQPAASKGKTVQGWKFIDPLVDARAKEIFDSPPASISAKLAKPVVLIKLADKSGKTTTIEISAASGDAVYARTSVGPSIYKLDKQVRTDLSFKVSDLLF